MSADIEAIITGLETMDLTALRAEWRRRYGAPPPLRSKSLMQRLLAWHIQADSCGGLDPRTRRALRRKGSPQAEGLQLGIGTRLTRNWKGRTIEVVVEEDGFRFENRLFASLSAAATAIAGSKWNGPRFFGLRDT